MTTDRLARTVDVALATGLLGVLLIRLFPHWEIAVSRQFFDPVTGWHWDANFWVQLAYHCGPLPALTLAVTGLIIALAALRWAPLRRYRRIGWFLFATMVLGPGVLVNSVFKENFDRPRPRDIVEFNGSAAYLPPGQAGASGHGRSFPSGHASMGFFLAAPYFFLRQRHPRLAMAALVVGTTAGLSIGFVRIMQGGHFLSDVIVAGLFVWITAHLTWLLTGRVAAGRGSPTPAVAPTPIPVPYLHGRVNCLDRAVYLRDRQTSHRPLVSIIVPFYNEESNVDDVLAEIRSVQPDAEIIAIDDGSRDGTWERIRTRPAVIGLSHPINQGQSAAILSGLRHAQGEFCVLMDGDGQNDPADIARLLAAWREGTADVICGFRANRRDTWSRRAASRFANRVRRLFLHDGVRDTGCSLKLFHRTAIDLLPPFNGLHRYLPAFFRQAGLSLQEVPVNHRPRSAGVSKYTNWQRGLVGLHDLVGVSWLLRRHLALRPPRSFPCTTRCSPLTAGWSPPGNSSATSASVCLRVDGLCS